MSKEIEEMAIAMAGCGKADCSSCKLRCEGLCASYKDASRAYAAGYRRQSEGEWQKRIWIIFDSEIVGYRCSECNTTWDAPNNYCPNCGAKMKGGAE
jgi:rubrerythrin